jgi:hypothetical protein
MDGVSVGFVGGQARFAIRKHEGAPMTTEASRAGVTSDEAGGVPVCHHLVENGGRGCSCRDVDAQLAVITAQRDSLLVAGEMWMTMHRCADHTNRHCSELREALARARQEEPNMSDRIVK